MALGAMASPEATRLAVAKLATALLERLVGEMGCMGVVLLGGVQGNVALSTARTCARGERRMAANRT